MSAVGFPTLVSQNNKLTRFADLRALPSKFIFLKDKVFLPSKRINWRENHLLVVNLRLNLDNLQGLIQNWWQKRDIYGEPFAQDKQAQGRNSGYQVLSWLWQPMRMVPQWKTEIQRIYIQLVHLLAFNLSCSLLVKSYNVFRTMWKPWRWVYYTPHLGVKQGRICLASGRVFVLTASTCKKTVWRSKDWLLNGGPKSQEWGQGRDLSYSTLIFHELFQRFTGARGGSSHNRGTYRVRREAQLHMESNDKHI